jgi:hypothetical protein
MNGEMEITVEVVRALDHAQRGVPLDGRDVAALRDFEQSSSTVRSKGFDTDPHRESGGELTERDKDIIDVTADVLRELKLKRDAQVAALEADLARLNLFYRDVRRIEERVAALEQAHAADVAVLEAELAKRG